MAAQILPQNYKQLEIEFRALQRLVVSWWGLGRFGLLDPYRDSPFCTGVSKVSEMGCLNPYTLYPQYELQMSPDKLRG